jgi:transposase
MAGDRAAFAEQAPRCGAGGRPAGVERHVGFAALRVWVLRSGSPWRDLPERYGPYTTCYNRFRRWTKAGVWDRIMDAITDAYGGDIRMIDGTSVRVHHAAATLRKSHPNDVLDEAGAVLRRKSML